MKKIIFLLFILAGFSGFAQHTITPSGTESVVVTNTVKISGTITASPAGTQTVTGNTGGFTFISINSITTKTTAYVSGNNVGGIYFISCLRSNGSTGIIEDITIFDNNAQNAPLTIDFWTASPTSGTYNDGVAEVIAGDASKYLGTITVLNTDYITTGTASRASLKGIGLGVTGVISSTKVWFTIMTTGTPTYTTTSGLYVKETVLQD